jgi:Transposase
MKRTRFSEEQMVKILREADKAPVSEVAKKHGVSDVTIYSEPDGVTLHVRFYEGGGLWDPPLLAARKFTHVRPMCSFIRAPL